MPDVNPFSPIVLPDEMVLAARVQTLTKQVFFDFLT